MLRPFSAYDASAAPLTVEQRLAQLEARLNHAEQEAGEAKRRAQQAELRTSAAEQRAAAAEKQVQTLSQRTAATEQKQQAADKQLAKSSLSDGFEFNAYARSGMLVDSHGKGARGGPGISRPVRSTAMPTLAVSATRKITTWSSASAKNDLQRRVMGAL